MPWKKGRQEGYTAFSLEVRVCQDDNGMVFSVHDYATEKDRQVAHALVSAGERQTAHALLTEALRRELFVTALARMSAGEDLVTAWREADEDGRRGLEAGLATEARTLLHRTIHKMGPDCAREIFSMLGLSGS